MRVKPVCSKVQFAFQCLLIAWNATGLFGVRIAFGESEISGSIPGSAFKCAPNALYMFLLLSGRPELTYEQLPDLQQSPDGVSLATMCAACAAFDIRTDVRTYDCADIDALPLPAIGLFRSMESSYSPYHYMVIINVTADRVVALDGTTGRRIEILRSHLSNIWTGIALVRSRSKSGIAVNASKVVLAAAIVGIDVYLLLSVVPRFKLRHMIVRRAQKAGA